jgi:hypothetical protein
MLRTQALESNMRLYRLTQKTRGTDTIVQGINALRTPLIDGVGRRFMRIKRVARSASSVTKREQAQTDYNPGFDDPALNKALRTLK